MKPYSIKGCAFSIKWSNQVASITALTTTKTEGKKGNICLHYITSLGHEKLYFYLYSSYSTMHTPQWYQRLPVVTVPYPSVVATTTCSYSTMNTPQW